MYNDGGYHLTNTKLTFNNIITTYFQFIPLEKEKKKREKE